MKSILKLVVTSGVLFISAQTLAADVCDISDSGCATATTTAPRQAPVQTLGQSYVPAPAVAPQLPPMPTATTLPEPPPAFVPAPPVAQQSYANYDYNYNRQPIVIEQPRVIRGYGQVDNTSSDNYSKCQQLFVSSGYHFEFGARSTLCNNVRSDYGLQALRTLVSTRQAISDRDLSSVLRIRTSQAVDCVSQIALSGYLNFAEQDRMAACADQAVSDQGISALQALIAQRIQISGDQLVNALRFRSDSGVSCLRLFQAMGYHLDYGNRIGLCRAFVNDSQVAALRIYTSSAVAISDTTLQSIASGRY